MLCDAAARHVDRPFPRQVLIGLSFGASAAAATLSGVRIDGGLLVDGRGFLIGTAAALGGLPTSAVALPIAGTARACMGGPWMPAGLLGNLVAAATGLAWTVRSPFAPGCRVSERLLFGLALSLHVLVHALSTESVQIPSLVLMLAVAAIGYAAMAAAFGAPLDRGQHATPNPDS